MGLEDIWDDVNQAFNLVKICDKAVDTLGCSLLGLASLVVGAQSSKMFWLTLVIQESLEGGSGYFSFTGSFHVKPHLLGIALHVVDSIHDPLLVVMVGDWLDCEKVFTAPDECLEYLLVLTGVLLGVVERMTGFFGNHIRDVGVL